MEKLHMLTFPTFFLLPIFCYFYKGTISNEVEGKDKLVVSRVLGLLEYKKSLIMTTLRY